jgi:hypothetical protein
MDLQWVVTDNGMAYDPTDDTLSLTIRKPSGAEVSEIPTVELIDGLNMVAYTIEEGLLDEHGVWVAELTWETAAGDTPRGAVRITTFQVDG